MKRISKLAACFVTATALAVPFAVGGQSYVFANDSAVLKPIAQVAVVASNITLNKKLSDSEIQDWISEYNNNGGVSDLERDIVMLTNAERAKVGLKPLEIDENMMMAARFKSQEMIDSDYFDHTSPHTGDFYLGPERLGADAYGENIVIWPNGTAEFFVQAWMDSAPHRENILNPEYETIGAGSVDNHATQLFGYK